MSIFDEQLAQGRNVFVPLEALQEHISATWLELERLGRFPGYRRGDYPLGSPEYHLAAVTEYTQQVFQLLAAMLPALYAADEEHRPAAEIIARIRVAAQE